MTPTSPAPPLRQTAKDRSGFTLVELIVVLVILAILASLLVPALTGYIDKARDAQLQATAHDLQVALQTVAVDFYVENGPGPYKGWGHIYYGGKKLGGEYNLQAFLKDVFALAEHTDIRDNFGNPSECDRFVFAKLDKTGKIQYVFYVDGSRYCFLRSDGTCTCGKIEENAYETWNGLTGEGPLDPDYGGNKLTYRRSYVKLY